MRQCILKTIKNDELQEIINRCNSLSKILEILGLTKSSPFHRKILKSRMEELDTTTYNKNRETSNIYENNWKKHNDPDSVIFSKDMNINFQRVKRRYISLFPQKNCHSCNIEPFWNGKKLNFHLDHINGVNTDHRLENLRWLCPNCHSQTETYTGRNKKVKPAKKENHCCDCGDVIDRQAERCVECSRINSRKIKWPPKEELERMVWEKPTSILCKELGVSDVAISKHCNRLGIKKPGRGYWEKLK